MQIFSFIEGIQTLQAIILAAGLLFLIIEVFTPGFGAAGGTGLLLLVIGIILTARSAFEAFIMVVILIFIIAVLLIFIIRSAKKGTLHKKMVLQSAANREDGFISTPDMSSLIGKEGKAITILRPAGTGEFHDQRYDVVSEGSFIAADTKIRVIQTEGRRIVVEPVK